MTTTHSDSGAATAPAPDTARPDTDPFVNAIARLARLFTLDQTGRPLIGTGPAAELRRMDPAAPTLPPAFWACLLAHVPEPLRSFDAGGTAIPHERAERAWAVILNGLAVMTPEPHQPRARIGEVLRDTGYSEPRFVRLLRAEGPALPQEAGIACRWLRAKGRPIDWIDFGRFIHARMTGNHDQAERHAHRMARAYFRAAAASDAQPER
jgi:hypothetical protein